MKREKQLQESIYSFHTQRINKSIPGDAFLLSLAYEDSLATSPKFYMFEVTQGKPRLKHLFGTGDTE